MSCVLVSRSLNQLLLLFVQIDKEWSVARVLITLADAHALGGVAGVQACQRPLLGRDGPSGNAGFIYSISVTYTS